MRNTGQGPETVRSTAIELDSILEPSSIRHSVWQERILFLLNFVRNPLQNASVIPSSKQAGKAILADLDWNSIDTIVELGPGNGIFTAEICKQCKPNTQIILIEVEATYVQLLRNKFGSRVHVVHDGAHRMNEILREKNLPRADLIVSSLPFLQKQVSRKIFQAILQQTGTGAAFRFFTYIPPLMKWFYRGLPLHKVRFVLKNIPPMWIYGIN